MKSEIGSDFWDYPVEECESNFKVDDLPSSFEYTYTISGRSAIYTVLCQEGLNNTTVLLPYFTCDTITEVFIKAGCRIVRYKVNRNLTCNVDDIFNCINSYNPRIVFLQDYFGFETLNSIQAVVDEIHKNNGIVITDLTHSLFSRFKKNISDIYVMSLRKFFAIPCGGVIVSKKKYNTTVSSELQKIDELSFKAFAHKKDYIFEKTQLGKSYYLTEYKMLHSCISIISQLSISKAGQEVIKQVDKNKLGIIRRRNYNYLRNILKDNNYIETIMGEATNLVTPLFFPIYVKNGMRDRLKSFLVSNDVYTPVIWPKDRFLDVSDSDGDFIYDNILCIPCDQRYDLNDMQRIINLIEVFYG